MGIHRGLNIVRDGLLFGYDTGYGVADNSTATRFYPGEPTTNLVTTNLETLGTDGSGQSSVGTRTTIAPNHVRIVDVTSNTRQSHLIQGLTASTTYTVSIQFKKVTGTPTFRFQIQGYNNSSYVSTIKFTNTAETGLLDIDGWQTAKWTFTLPSNCNAARIWWQDGADYTTYTHTFELKNPQLEAKGHVTPYVSGTRSSTQSLIDLKRTTNIDVSNASFDSTGQPDLDGTGDFIKASSTHSITGDITLEGVFNEDTSSSPHTTVICTDKDYQYGVKLMAFKNSSRYGLWLGFGSSSYIAMVDGSFSNNTSYHLAGSWDRSSGVVKIYLNGDLKSTISTGQTSAVSLNEAKVVVGADYHSLSYGLNGKVYVGKVYNKVLTDAEVKQNYNAYKNRFNI